MAGLFGILDVGKSGLFAQQDAINVTSHNIANANTSGYTRQRAEFQASRPATAYPGQMGTGVDVVDINRIRDSFNDYSVRSSNSTVEKYSAASTFLSQVEDIINEPTDDKSGFSYLLGQFFDAWNTLGTHGGEYDSKSGVAKAARALTDNLNEMSNKLAQLKEDAQDKIQETLITNVNSVLDKINSLNQQIEKLESSGQTPNDLMDQRDNLIDNLSSQFGINIVSRKNEGIDLTTSNESDSSEVTNNNGIPPLSADGTSINLVDSSDPDGGYRFSYINDIKPADGQQAGEAGKYTVTYYKNGDKSSESNKVTITVDIEDTGKPGDDDYVSTEDKYKQLNTARVIWADSSGTALKVDKSVKSQGIVQGTIASDGSASVKFEDLAIFQPPSGDMNGYVQAQQYIDKYQSQLDQEAKAIAFAVNAIISQSPDALADTSTNINNFFVNSLMESNYTDASSVSDAEKGITAANITINEAILDNPNLIKSAAQYDSDGNRISAENDGTRAVAIEMLRDQRIGITSIENTTDKAAFLSNNIFEEDSTIGSAPIYTIKGNTTDMTFDTNFRKIVSTIGSDELGIKDNITSNTNILNSALEVRNSISGVSLDEEMANLVQFQHCYQANGKIIATVDELLNVVINGLKK